MAGPRLGCASVDLQSTGRPSPVSGKSLAPPLASGFLGQVSYHPSLNSSVKWKNSICQERQKVDTWDSFVVVPK